MHPEPVAPFFLCFENVLQTSSLQQIETKYDKAYQPCPQENSVALDGNMQAFLVTDMPPQQSSTSRWALPNFLTSSLNYNKTFFSELNSQFQASVKMYVTTAVSSAQMQIGPFITFFDHK